ncbi:MtrAB system histidine kinase MtrB [Ruania albidiflava]|uniref:MtrAB system histidine kinase MtrB n=1 Tax=Ruania albidiflava TaxID=366586 RepID=UPI00040DB3D5|nr:MtrAB system histidine kinase MtrB [Ruania albidiflava]
MNAPAGRHRPWRERAVRTTIRASRWLRRRTRVALRTWRHSLRLRVAATTVAVGSLALVLLAAVLADQVRDGLFDQARDQVLADAASRAEQAQQQFDSATVSNVQDVQQLGDDVVSTLQQSSLDAAGVLLLPSPDPSSSVLIQAPATDNSLRAVIHDELREQVRAEQFQQWQSVALPTSNGAVVPGIAVGAPVTMPVAGENELYIVYSLASEQAQLDLLQRVLAVGAGSLVVLLLVMAWYLTRQVLDPVQQAARTAERLADGHLTERMQVRGHDELASLGSSFNEMAASLQDQIERLAELSRMQQRFVSDVSHELRTPLSTVRMAAEVLYQARESFPPSQARSAELLQNQLDRFENLLVDLLEISRFDAGAAVLDVEVLDLHLVLDRVVALTGPLAAERGSHILVHAPADPVTVDADARRVERVLRNLLVNAVEHGEGNDIDVTLAAHHTAVSVLVRDHGIGMTPVQAEHVFDRFWRADPARARTLGGTGLGLAIALEDARLHGGGLDAWGTPGEGAAFRLTLPRRAGLEIGEPPLALWPERAEADLDHPVDPSDPAGPAAVPQWEQEEST